MFEDCCWLACLKGFATGNYTLLFAALPVAGASVTLTQTATDGFKVAERKNFEAFGCGDVADGRYWAVLGECDGDGERGVVGGGGADGQLTVASEAEDGGIPTPCGSRLRWYRSGRRLANRYSGAAASACLSLSLLRSRLRLVCGSDEGKWGRWCSMRCGGRIEWWRLRLGRARLRVSPSGRVGCFLQSKVRAGRR